jgi:hypothetical protein
MDNNFVGFAVHENENKVKDVENSISKSLLNINSFERNNYCIKKYRTIIIISFILFLILITIGWLKFFNIL